MSQFIVYSNPDSSIVIISPSTEGLTKYNNDIDALAAVEVPPATTYDIVTETAFPTDPYFRDAWEWDIATLTVIVDLIKAESVHRDELKKKRGPKWKLAGLPENSNASFDSMLDPTDAQLAADLRGVDTYDLSMNTDADMMMADIPSYLV